METFKVGEIVRLKSGGPRMTVSSIITEGLQPGIYCTWFATVKGSQEVKGAVFQPETLMREEDEAPRRVHDSEA